MQNTFQLALPDNHAIRIETTTQTELCRRCIAGAHCAFYRIKPIVREGENSQAKSIYDKTVANGDVATLSENAAEQTLIVETTWGALKSTWK